MLERTIPHPAAVPAPPAAISRILAQFDRRQIECFIEVAIRLLDLADGDPEAEEDDPHEESEGMLTRCDERGYALGGQAVPLGQHEDDEDDDAGGGNVLDEPHDQEEGFLLIYGIDQTRPIGSDNPLVP
jgi:hypothetical protein